MSNFWTAHTSSTELAKDDVLFFRDMTGSAGPLRNVADKLLALHMAGHKVSGDIKVTIIAPQTLECIWKRKTYKFKPAPIMPLPPHMIPHHWIVV